MPEHPLQGYLRRYGTTKTLVEQFGIKSTRNKKQKNLFKFERIELRILQEELDDFYLTRSMNKSIILNSDNWEISNDWPI